MNQELFSDIKIWPIKNAKGSFKANGQVTIAGVVSAKFTVIEGPNGVFASFPSDKGEKEGKTVYYPYVRIIDKDHYSLFQDKIKTAYIKTIGDNSSGQEVAGEEPQATPKRDNIPF